MSKSNYISKHTKNIIYEKNERQVNSNLLCKFGHYWRKLNFWAPKTPFLGSQTRYDVIWNFTPIFIFSSLRILYVKMTTSEVGGWIISRPYSIQFERKWNTSSLRVVTFIYGAAPYMNVFSKKLSLFFFRKNKFLIHRFWWFKQCL